jgi:hypothetical protein
MGLFLRCDRIAMTYLPGNAFCGSIRWAVAFVFKLL